MAARNPRAPTRKQIKAVFGDDKRWIKAIEQLFEVVPDDLDESIDELFDSLFSWLGPAVNKSFGKAFEQDKLTRDIVEEIATDRINIARVSGNLGEFKKIVADQAAFVSELIATVARLNGKLGELTKPRPIRFESGTYQILDNDSGVVADASGGDFDVTLPDPTKNTDKDYFLQTLDTGGTATLLPFASEAISGDVDLDVPSTSPMSCAVVKSDGTDWIIK